MTTNSFDFGDRPERDVAATTFDRNVVVTAGAGTGKTSLLVDRVIHLVMREPDPLALTEIVALTFTNKAAGEIKVRLREKLESYVEARLDRAAARSAEERSAAEIRVLMERYRLSKDRIDERATRALQQLERSQIGTIHSFAAALLRLYPLESGLDPQFHEDDGNAFAAHFKQSWLVWLDRELGASGPAKEEWKEALRRLPLGDIEAVARAFCSETIPLDHLTAESGINSTHPRVAAWIDKLDREAKSLLERHPQNRLNEQVVRASSEILTALAKKSTLSIADVPAENRRLLEKEARHGVKGWTADEVARANAIARAARRFLQLDPGFMETLCRLLIPFARHCREGFVRQGLISFDALLVRARDLLRDHVGVRQELKAQYRALLIDEFQDTDPIQYEILLYLAERPDRAATEWRGIELTPGKIFVVGDPKQSIYAFRRADIEAYLRVVDELIKAQGGIECNLSTNFRSHAGILGVVNGLFERLIRPQPGLQPAYVAIHPRPDGQLESPERPPGGVLLRLLASDDGPMDARSARTVEAESLARWLAEEVFPRITLPDGEGKAQPARPRDVAILFRKLTHVYPYLDALRRWDIPYVVEGERHFYSAPEIIDAINLLRAIEDPHDRAALVGLLRSPLGGLDDREIYELSEAGLLDYRAAARLPKSSPARAVYAPLASLHERVGTLPVAEALLSVFASFPIRVLAAHSSRGEQAVANVDKLRHQILLLGPQATFKEIVANLRRRVEEVQEESEGALAEENLDAVRILSIHKAKGLEFPMVVIAGVHAGVEEQEQALVDYDWTTGLVGIHVGGHWNLPGIFLAENRRLRVREEQKRLFYVAMTRAKEHLTLSGASGARKSPGSFLAMLEEGLGDGLVNLEESGTIAVGSALIEHRRVRETPRPPTRPTREGGAPRVFDSSAYASLWEAREAARRAIMNTPRFTNPTALARADLARKPAGSRKRRKSRSPDRAALLGELTHRFLARWDFSAPARGLDSEVELFLNSAGNPGLAAERATVEKEMRKILRRFFSSDAYAEFADARILAREAPFLIDWNGQIMEGVIDVLFENDEGLFIGDYKTDDVRRRDLRDRAKSYRHQVKAYAEAARRSLKRDVAGCKIIFLRLGEAIEVPLL